MKRFCAALVLWLFLCSLARADLEADIRAVLADRFLHDAAVGVEVIQLGPTAEGDRILFKHQADVPLMPASNMKLVTTSSALDRLGADFRFRTLLVKRDDDLILVGDGDPTFGDAELLKKAGWDVTTVFENWAKGLKKAGYESVGDVLVDDSVFDEQLIHPNWDPNQLQARYSAEIAGMTLNLGCLDLAVRSGGAGRRAAYTTNPPTRYVSIQNSCITGRTNAVVLDRAKGTNQVVLKGTCPGSGEVAVTITVHDPALYAATVLAETLTASGIKVRGKIGRDRGVRKQMGGLGSGGVGREESAPHSPTSQRPHLSVLAAHETPLARALERANKDSSNPYAEALCKRAGFAASGEGSWPGGSAASTAFLKQLGIDPAEFTLDDGSGLSRENRLSAGALARVLQYDFHSKNHSVFVSSLSVAGQDGTLDERFKGDLRGRVFGKSGYIVGVSALSGYLQTGDGRTFAFSILMNDLSRGGNAKAKQLQEAIVKAIDGGKQ